MTVIFQLPENLLQRRLVTESGCWEWQGCRRSGYGRVWRDGRLLTVHRLVAHLVFDLDLSDRWTLVCHRCDNPPCFNPDHLFLGTPSDNNDDRDRKGRSRPPYTYMEAPTVYPRVRPCLVCSHEYEPDRDHRGRSVVCSSACHSELKRRNGLGRSSSLTPEDVRLIRAELESGSRGTAARLAERYGVKPSVITCIKQGKTWGWVE